VIYDVETQKYFPEYGDAFSHHLEKAMKFTSIETAQNVINNSLQALGSGSEFAGRKLNIHDCPTPTVSSSFMFYTY